MDSNDRYTEPSNTTSQRVRSTNVDPNISTTVAPNGPPAMGQRSRKNEERYNRPRKPKQARPRVNEPDGVFTVTEKPSNAHPQRRYPRPRDDRKPQDNTPSNESSTASSSKTPRNTSEGPSAFRRGHRGAKFNAGLTSDSSVSKAAPSTKPSRSARAPEPDDLTSRLIAALRTPPYPDCPICFSAIYPAQPIWSCSPSIPVIGQEQYCWTTFHLKCIRSWAGKSVKEVADAWRARGEMDKEGDWRCPGCQAKRAAVPSGYW